MFTSRIINNTADPVRRGKVEAWLGYDADLRQAVQTARDAAGKAEGVLQAPAPAVRIDELGQTDIVLEITFWTDSRRGDYKNTASTVRQALVLAFKNAQIGLPEPMCGCSDPSASTIGGKLLRKQVAEGGRRADAQRLTKSGRDRAGHEHSTFTTSHSPDPSTERLRDCRHCARVIARTFY